MKNLTAHIAEISADISVVRYVEHKWPKCSLIHHCAISCSFCWHELVLGVPGGTAEVCKSVDFTRNFQNDIPIETDLEPFYNASIETLSLAYKKFCINFYIAEMQF